MALDLAILNGHMDRVFTDFPLVAYWQGVGIPCVRSTPQLSQLLEVGGPEEKIEFDLFMRRSELPKMPKESDVFVVSGIKMKVASVRAAPENGELVAFGMAFAKQGDYP